ncbi:MAG TPA: hypothetical protein VF463_07780 [Sphingobium sp.]
MTDIQPVFNGLHNIDDDEAALAALPVKADRLAYHAKRLPGIQFMEGAEGVKRYTTKFPEARVVHLNTGWTTASLPKPAGHDDALCSIVRAWFASSTALSETNRATVSRMNDRLNARAGDPDRYFSTGLSKGRLEKLAAVFTENGARLVTTKDMSMSDVRAAVKVVKGHRSPGQPFGSVGHTTGNQLIIGSQTFTVMQHHGHASIKITLNGKRLWLRLDVAAEFVTLAGLVSGDGVGRHDPVSLLSVAIREVVPDDDNGAFDPLVGIAEIHSSGEVVPISDAAIYSPATLVPDDEPAPHSLEELVPDAPPSLAETFAAKRTASLNAALMGTAADGAHSTARPADPDADPLAFS